MHSFIPQILANVTYVAHRSAQDPTSTFRANIQDDRQVKMWVVTAPLAKGVVVQSLGCWGACEQGMKSQTSDMASQWKYHLNWTTQGLIVCLANWLRVSSWKWWVGKALGSRNSVCKGPVAPLLYLYNQNGIGQKRYIYVLGFSVWVSSKSVLLLTKN